MTIYSLYIFDRHCECVYYQSWHRTTPIRPGKDVLPNVAPGTRLPSKLEEEEEAAKKAAEEEEQALKSASMNSNMSNMTINTYNGIPRAPPPLPSSSSSAPTITSTSGTTILPSSYSNTNQAHGNTDANEESNDTSESSGRKRGLPFDEECKLVYGILFSLRSMMKKLSNKEDETFISYKTSSYKLHLFETISGYKFILFSDSNIESLKFILKQIYQVCFVEFVLRNPSIEILDSRISGKGIDSMAFRMSVHKFISGLTVFR